MRDAYESPLNERYASRDMQYIFSPDKKYRTWRLLWTALAEAEMRLGLSVTPEQVAEMRAHIDDIDYAAVREYEKRTRHDVMAHILAYGDACPNARGIIHLGATSCYVTDNADILMLREALSLVRVKLLEVISRLKAFAWEHRALPALGYTHIQPAQLTTVGKRAALWMQDLLMDVCDIDGAISSLKLLGCRGATGSMQTFIELFGGDIGKACELERLIADDIGMSAVFDVSGQTYPRKLDSRVLFALSGVAQSAYKFAQDMRLLQAFGELEEPFESGQVGSSAMAYKRNPMRCERICALARHAMTLTQNAQATASAQCLERTLDDSANRRLTLPEAFLCVDAVLELYANVANGIVVNAAVISRRVSENLPFIATEAMLMEAVNRGYDRQEMHELIREHSQETLVMMRRDGGECDLITRLDEDPAFPLAEPELQSLLDPSKHIGAAEMQTREFIEGAVNDALKGHTPVDMGNIEI